MASPTKPARSTRSSVRPSARPPVRPSGDYGEAFPNSNKVYVEGPQGFGCRCGRSRSPAASRRSGCTTPAGRRDSMCGRDCRRFGGIGLPAPVMRVTARRHEPRGRRSGRFRAPLAARAGGSAPRCLDPPTLRAGLSAARGPITQLHYARRARSPRRWSSSPSGKGCRPSSSAARSRGAAPSSPPTSTTPSWSR